MKVDQFFIDVKCNFRKKIEKEKQRPNVVVFYAHHVNEKISALLSIKTKEHRYIVHGWKKKFFRYFHFKFDFKIKNETMRKMQTII